MKDPWVAQQLAKAETRLQLLVAVERRVRRLKDAGDHERAAATALEYLAHLETEAMGPTPLEAALADTPLAGTPNLTARIVHEIRNPLSFVSSFAQLSRHTLGELSEALAAESERLTPQAHAELSELVRDLQSNAERIHEHVQRADGVVRGMVEHSRGLQGEVQRTDLNALFQESLRHVSDLQPGATPVEVTESFDPTLAPMEVVPRGLAQVLRNLIENAFYALRARPHPAPRLWLTTREEEGRVELSVRDNGGGIPPEVLEEVLRPFFSTKPASEGTGLGLAICHEIVTRLHRGELKVESEGQETCVRVSLPRAP